MVLPVNRFECVRDGLLSSLLVHGQGFPLA